MIIHTLVIGVAILTFTKPIQAQETVNHELHIVAKELLPKLGQPNPPGNVLFSEDWNQGDWSDSWDPSAGWTVMQRPRGDGFCARVVSSSSYHNLKLKQKVPFESGHPIAVFWRARLLSGKAPVWISVSGKDAEGQSAGGRQQIFRQGRKWTDCAVLVSDWFHATNACQFSMMFFMDPISNTTALVDDLIIVDLYQAAVESVRSQFLSLPRQAEKLKSELDSLPDTPAAQWWKQTMATSYQAVLDELGKAQSLDPASPQAVNAVLQADQVLARFQDIADGLRSGSVRNSRLAGFATRPVTPDGILPDTIDLPGASLDGLYLTAAPGEIESASLVLWAPETLTSVMPTVTDLAGPNDGNIPADQVQIKWVKCWWQSGTAPRSHGQDYSRKVLVPELLLNNNDLVRVDLEGQHNTLLLDFPEGARYVAIDEPLKSRKAGFSYQITEFPVKDSQQLLPATLPARQNKQVWITVKVPSSARPGRYKGSLRVTAAPDTLMVVPLSVEVLPFTLPSPRTHYDLSREYTGSIYYWGQLDPAGIGSVGFRQKNEKQLRAELLMMRENNLVAPTMIWSPKLLYHDEPLLRRHLAILRDLGMSNHPLTLGDSGTVGNPTEPDDVAQLQNNVRKVLRAAAEHGFTDVYFYGIDEAKGDLLSSQKKAWQAVREAGGKVMTSGSLGMTTIYGPLLDLINNCMPAPSCEAAGWHNHGRLVWNYGNPQSANEDPEMFRRNYGLINWWNDLDGTCTYCFSAADGAPWNDFDFVMRDHSLAYPTADGVIGTLALAGMREGLDDVKYASALRLRIEEASRATSAELKTQSAAARTWLESLDLNTADLDGVRQGIIKLICQLDQGLGKEIGSESSRSN